MKFSEAKSKIIKYLISIASREDDPKRRQELTTLIMKLQYLRYRDLAQWLAMLWSFCNYYDKVEICKYIVDILDQVKKGEEDE